MSDEDDAVVVGAAPGVGLDFFLVAFDLDGFDVVALVGGGPEVEDGLVDLFHLLVVELHEGFIESVVLFVHFLLEEFVEVVPGFDVCELLFDVFEVSVADFDLDLPFSVDERDFLPALLVVNCSDVFSFLHDFFLLLKNFGVLNDEFVVTFDFLAESFDFLFEAFGFSNLLNSSIVVG